MTTCQVPEKWEFMDAEKISVAIGIEESRWGQLSDIAKDAALRAIIYDRNINTPSQMYALALNEAVPKNMIEAFALGVLLSNYEGQAESIAKKIAKVTQDR